MRKVILSGIMIGIISLLWEIYSLSFKLGLNMRNLLLMSLAGFVVSYFILFFVLKFSLKGEPGRHYVFAEIFKRGIIFSIAYSLIMMAGVYIYYKQNPEVLDQIKTLVKANINREGQMEEAEAERSIALVIQNYEPEKLAIGQAFNIFLGAIFTLISSFILRQRLEGDSPETSGTESET